MPTYKHKKICRLPSCKKEFQTNRDWQDFCEPEHQKEFHRLLQRSHEGTIVELELLKVRVLDIEKNLDEANIRIPQMIKDFMAGKASDIVGNKKK